MNSWTIISPVSICNRVSISSLSFPVPLLPLWPASDQGLHELLHGVFRKGPNRCCPSLKGICGSSSASVVLEIRLGALGELLDDGCKDHFGRIVGRLMKTAVLQLSPFCGARSYSHRCVVLNLLVRNFADGLPLANSLGGRGTY
jgi:hypothetical protein